MSSRKLFVVGSIALVSMLVCELATYYVGAHYLAAGNLDVEPFTYSTPFVGGGDDTEPKFEEENPMVYVTVPRAVTLPGTFTVEASLEQNLPSVARLNGEKFRMLNYDASLAGPNFDITPAPGMINKTAEGKVAWEWLAEPKQLGDHAIRLQFKQSVISQKSIDYLKQQKDIDPNIVITPDSVICHLTVLTSLGLTS